MVPRAVGTALVARLGVNFARWHPTIERAVAQRPVIDPPVAAVTRPPRMVIPR